MIRIHRRQNHSVVALLYLFSRSFIISTIMRLLSYIVIQAALCFFFISHTHAQNLVPNSSFEEIENPPIRPNLNNAYEYEPNSGHIPFTYNLGNWEAGSEATPDLRIKDKKKLSDCQRVLRDCDFPKDGINSVGIITFLQNYETDTYREYVQVKLKKPLVPGEPTHYSFWLSKERLARLASNNIGLYFSNKIHFREDKDPFDFIPQVNVDSLINADVKRWVNVKGSFVPEKPYTHVMLGNFFNNEKTTTAVYPNFLGSERIPPYAYYLVDDVKIWQFEAPTEKSAETTPQLPLLARDSIILNFDIAKYDLTPEHWTAISAFFARDSSADQYHFIIEGATDFLGDANKNQRLSEQRANALHDYVQSNFASKIASITQRGVGELNDKPTTTAGDRGVRQHRRVLMYLDPASLPQSKAELASLLSMTPGERIVFAALNFIPGKTKLLKKSIPSLFELRDLLLENTSLNLEIVGHVCCPYPDSAPDVDNLQLKLSEGRAKNIYDYLVGKGVAAERLRWSGKGDTDPLVWPEETKEDQAQNRRVELLIIE